MGLTHQEQDKKITEKQKHISFCQHCHSSNINKWKDGTLSKMLFVGYNLSSKLKVISI